MAKPAWFILCTRPSEWHSNQRFISEPRRGEFSVIDHEGRATRYGSRVVANRHAEAALAKGLQVYLRQVA